MYGWTFQRRAYEWAAHVLGKKGGAAYIPERNLRFLEEALELVQANGLSKNDAMRLVNYVYERPAGDIGQELGGVMVTLAVLCQVVGLDYVGHGETELNRCWQKADKIREKQLAKEIRYEEPNER